MRAPLTSLPRAPGCRGRPAPAARGHRAAGGRHCRLRFLRLAPCRPLQAELRLTRCVMVVRPCVFRGGAGREPACIRAAAALRQSTAEPISRPGWAAEPASTAIGIARDPTAASPALALVSAASPVLPPRHAPCRPALPRIDPWPRFRSGSRRLPARLSAHQGQQPLLTLAATPVSPWRSRTAMPPGRSWCPTCEQGWGDLGYLCGAHGKGVGAAELQALHARIAGQAARLRVAVACCPPLLLLQSPLPVRCLPASPWLRPPHLPRRPAGMTGLPRTACRGPRWPAAGAPCWSKGPRRTGSGCTCPSRRTAASPTASS